MWSLDISQILPLGQPQFNVIKDHVELHQFYVIIDTCGAYKSVESSFY